MNMQVNVPFDRPLMSPTEFTEGYYPAVQLRTLPPGLSLLVPKVASMLLNAAQQAATSNPARMLALNALVQNNVNNHLYEMVVDMTIRLAALKALQTNAPNNAIGFVPEAVREALTLFTSGIIVANPVVQNVIPRQSLDAAFQNNMALQKLVNDIQRADFRAYENHAAASYVHGGGSQPYQHQQHQQAPYQHQQPTQAQLDRPSTGALSPWADPPPPSPPPSSPTSQAQWFSATPAPAGTPTPSSWVQADADVPMGLATIVPTVPLQKSEAEIGVGKEILTVNKGSEMEINVHCLPYFGSPVLLDLDGRREDFRSDAMTSIREGRRQSSNTHDPVILSPGRSYELNLDSAVFITNKEHASIPAPGRTGTIFRKFFHILDPIVVDSKASGLVGLICELPALDELPSRFRTIIEKIKDATNPSDEEKGVLNFAAYVDRRLAKFVNDFLYYNMRELDLHISSFAADRASLMEWLNKERGARHMSVYVGWENRLLEMIKVGNGDDSKKYLDEFFEEKSASTYGSIPYCASITTLALTNIELGLDVGKNGSAIDPKTTPVIYDLVKGIMSNKKDTNTATLNDIIFTADDYRYRVAEDVIQPGSFSIYAL